MLQEEALDNQISSAWLSGKPISDRILVPTNRCGTFENLEFHMELRIWAWISLAKNVAIFVP